MLSDTKIEALIEKLHLWRSGVGVIWPSTLEDLKKEGNNVEELEKTDKKTLNLQIQRVKRTDKYRSLILDLIKAKVRFALSTASSDGEGVFLNNTNKLNIVNGKEKYVRMRM